MRVVAVENNRGLPLRGKLQTYCCTTGYLTFQRGPWNG